MVLKLVEASDADLAKIRKLYLEAFPAVERVPFWLLKRRAKTPLAEFCSLYDDDAWRGFIYTVKDERLVYIFFLAIDASERSKGYGSGLMTLIKERYADKIIGLSAEMADEQAENNAERLRRLKFYAKNDFLPVDFYTLEKGGVKFEFLTEHGRKVAPMAYPDLMHRCLGIWQKLLLPVKVISKDS